MAVTHTHARMLKHKTHRVLQAKIKTTLEIMHDPKYTEMPNATHAKMKTIAGSAILRWHMKCYSYHVFNLEFENTMQLV